MSGRQWLRTDWETGISHFETFSFLSAGGRRGKGRPASCERRAAGLWSLPIDVRCLAAARSEPCGLSGSAAHLPPAPME